MNEKELYIQFKTDWYDRNNMFERNWNLYIKLLNWERFIKACQNNNFVILGPEFLQLIWDEWIQPFDYINYYLKIENMSIWKDMVNLTCDSSIQKVNQVIVQAMKEWKDLNRIFIDFAISWEDEYCKLAK